MNARDEVVAIFDPVDRSDLTPAACANVGVVLVWEAFRMIEEGPYAGMWEMAWTPDEDFYGLRTPLCDLVDPETGARLVPAPDSIVTP